MTAYYNEIDKFAAQWLRNLIDAGHIAPGVVDERSIEDVHPSDLRGFTQCHFFAGIGVWSYALRRAGWPDDRPVWTGSCPCQPFSAAGKGAGFADERHLWPAFHWLIQECRPVCVLGEQVAGKDADPWIDLVHADLEAVGYAFGCVPFPSAGVGAPHIRDRIYWMADAVRSGSLPGPHAGVHSRESGTGSRYGELERPGAACGLADAYRQQRQGGQSGVRFENGTGGWHENTATVAGFRGDSRPGPVNGFIYWLADADDSRLEGRKLGRDSAGKRIAWTGGMECEGRSPVNGFWRDADWLLCRDGKWRPVEPGASPLADGAPARMGRLRAFGNAINAEAATEFIRATGLIA